MRLVDRRIGLLFASFVLLFCAILARAVWIQTVQGGSLQESARSQQTEMVTVPNRRGRIFDRKGKELAVSEDASTVFATPYQVKDPERAASRLAPVLRVPASKILEKLADPESGFAYLAHKVSLTTAERVRRLHVAGIGLLPDSRRIYPQGELASQVIGTVGMENQGLNGLEEANEDVVGGTDGERRVVKDALGETLRVETVKQASTGKDMQLTIDGALQIQTERVLAELGAKYRPKGATAIVMDPRNGHVLAMANWPSADPSDLAGARPEDLQNRATGFTYEPGSTFKAFTVAAALEEGLVTPDTSFYLPPKIRVADRTIAESHPRGPVDLTVAQILAQSSNVGAVTVGLEVGATRFDKWVHRFGFGDQTGIEFPAEERGIVPGYDDYSGSTIGNLPIGQGLSVTPIQMAAGYSAIANGGILRQPRLVTRMGDDPVTPPEGRRIISERTSLQVRTMLEGVLAPGGTASEVSVPGYTLAGKTGTAEKAIEGGYSKVAFVPSFVGFAPAQDPRLLVAVMVDEPQGDIYGGSVAAPAFGEIARFALPYLGIPPR